MVETSYNYTIFFFNPKNERALNFELKFRCYHFVLFYALVCSLIAFYLSYKLDQFW